MEYNYLVHIIKSKISKAGKKEVRAHIRNEQMPREPRQPIIYVRFKVLLEKQQKGKEEIKKSGARDG